MDDGTFQRALFIFCSTSDTFFELIIFTARRRARRASAQQARAPPGTFSFLDARRLQLPTFSMLFTIASCSAFRCPRTAATFLMHAKCRSQYHRRCFDDDAGFEAHFCTVLPASATFYWLGQIITTRRARHELASAIAVARLPPPPFICSLMRDESPLLFFTIMPRAFRAARGYFLVPGIPPAGRSKPPCR